MGRNDDEIGAFLGRLLDNFFVRPTELDQFLNLHTDMVHEYPGASIACHQQSVTNAD